MIHHTENGLPYSPTGAVLAMALILTCQVGAVLAVVNGIRAAGEKQTKGMER